MTAQKKHNINQQLSKVNIFIYNYAWYGPCNRGTQVNTLNSRFFTSLLHQPNYHINYIYSIIIVHENISTIKPVNELNRNHANTLQTTLKSKNLAGKTSLPDESKQNHTSWTKPSFLLCPFLWLTARYLFASVYAPIKSGPLYHIEPEE